jgi:hypothetical protein
MVSGKTNKPKNSKKLFSRLGNCTKTGFLLVQQAGFSLGLE